MKYSKLIIYFKKGDENRQGTKVYYNKFAGMMATTMLTVTKLEARFTLRVGAEKTRGQL
jgi:hypothetical protein